jgi:two-component system, OmpR family, sensor histidine kinase SenX3
VTARIGRPSGLVVMVGAALVLLPILAVLQYRWIGQVSDAERERHERTLRHATSGLVQDLDRELVRALIVLQVDGDSDKNNDWSSYAERVAGWRSTAVAPGMVTSVLLVDRGPSGLRLRTWSPETRLFVESAWTAELEPYRHRFLDELTRWKAHPPAEPVRPPDLLSDDGSAIVAPLVPIPIQNEAGRVVEFEPVFGYTLIRLDMRFIKEEFLPALVDRHFRLEADDEYRIAIVPRGDSSVVIYQTNVENLRTLLAKPDAEAQFFGFLPDQFQLVRQVAESLGAALPANVEKRRNLFFNLTRRPPGDAGARPRPPQDDAARWRLVARHRAGSLEAAVASARTRNLALSFSVLLLMFTSVAVLAVTTGRAKRLVRQQMEFVAAVSHELRTPVSVISAAAENLADGLVLDPSRVKQYGARIQTEARRLGGTVERVLLYAGIEAGRAVGHRAPVAAATLVGEALAASAAAIDEAGVTLETDIATDLPPVLADASALRSSLQNLVGNALKYGGSGGWLRVAATTAQGRSGTEVRITVADRGLGIAAADLPHIFEPFFRGAEAQSQQIHGNGLGLSIVKGIVEAHGGRVAVESAQGRGSTFTVTLPACQGEASASSAIVGQADAPARGA